MINYEKERNLMVDRQIVARGVKDERVLSAMRKVPRHEFLPEALRGMAYGDSALPLGEGQTMSQPYMVALMTELLGLTEQSGSLRSGPVPGTRLPYSRKCAGRSIRWSASRRWLTGPGRLWTAWGIKASQ